MRLLALIVQDVVRIQRDHVSLVKRNPLSPHHLFLPQFTVSVPHGGPSQQPLHPIHLAPLGLNNVP